MPIGLICAIPQELGHLRTLLHDAAPVNAAHTEFVTGTLDGYDVVLAGSGMGKVNSALVATLLVGRFGCGTIVFSGVAGGLDPELAVGDVVIADHVVQHDAGLIEGDRLQTYQAGHVPFINPTDRFGYRVDPDLLACVVDRLDDFTLPALSGAAGGTDRPARIRFGTVLSGDQYVHCEATRQRLHGDFGGVAVEMEGGAVAQVAEAFGVSWLVIRALSDLAGHDSGFEFLAFVEEVAASSAAILLRLLPVLAD
ncbi:5'-methylthioadenosine/adenosylhomocysteine nucleosidase [Mycobacterium sp. CVI_P3]|uniref:adenosylhomocysteine nucleosidase n=1 Tax=Mycobacterium pinniadriaticum TaxID=2994102 RepID=A0ABT3S8J9_9MYCO|nr:5'-methylthioadenosine/adenosylhomocysteine nucleosidase [Mycobacterium pinniadriaticum]MCX2929404.1 5'-methylthioadenosine/adenosylhomocysteine nucleosidase [Mycobacterium pinniadriaticum]MCX2935828.1 5'-methylthioadenosine/adenosylhomocysteine nucleosidase [Mycobacterium pinniadriaticum]